MKKNINQKIFINNNKKNILIILILFIVVILFFFLTTSIFLNTKINVSESFKLDWQRTTQMFLTGFSLGIASYLLQKLTRNHLADTSIMGFGNFNLIPLSILAILTNFNLDPNSNKINIDTFNLISPIVIVATSMLLCSLFYIASYYKNRVNLKKLIVTGIILNFISLAIAFSIISLADPNAKKIIENYAIGYIAPSIPSFNFYFSFALILLALIILLINSNKLSIIMSNQDIAIEVGIKNSLNILIMMLSIGLLVGASYSMSGDFVFVGLIAGNIGNKLTKGKCASGILSSGLIGSIMVMCTYFVFQNLIDVPFTIIAPLIPLLISPYFIYLIVKWR